MQCIIESFPVLEFNIKFNVVLTHSNKKLFFTHSFEFCVVTANKTHILQ